MGDVGPYIDHLVVVMGECVMRIDLNLLLSSPDKLLGTIGMVPVKMSQNNGFHRPHGPPRNRVPTKSQPLLSNKQLKGRRWFEEERKRKADAKRKDKEVERKEREKAERRELKEDRRRE